MRSTQSKNDSVRDGTHLLTATAANPFKQETHSVTLRRPAQEYEPVFLPKRNNPSQLAAPHGCAFFSSHRHAMLRATFIPKEGQSWMSLNLSPADSA